MVDAATTEQAVNRKARTGTVVSDINDKTVIVAIERATRHRLYHKVIRQTKRYAVHDPDNRATIGDLVLIEECRPISKTKRWRLVDVLTEREVAEVAPESIGENLVDEVQRSAARAAAEAEETEGPGESSSDVATAEAETEVPVTEAAAPETEAPPAEVEAPEAEVTEAEEAAPEPEAAAEAAADPEPADEEAQNTDEERDQS
jgi:small subunit ribosomal protein S17